jgi:SAM-dependent MidA family methyltransferase
VENPLLHRLLSDIGRSGPISFGEFMEAALYDPDHGFYTRGGAGRRRDFITSPEVGPLYGAVVAQALDSWWDELDRPTRFSFVEAGAGAGALARSVLAVAPACLPALEYVAVESSAQQRAAHGDGLITRATLPEEIDVGVVFANELLDNLAFDLYEWAPDAGWSEVRVGAAAEELVEVLQPAPDFRAPLTGDEADQHLRVPDQYRARAWLGQALTIVGRGRVVVVDYAVASHESEPGREWLRTYRGHERGGDPLHQPGTQDITADIGLDQLAEAGEPAAITDQADWLNRHGLGELVNEGRAYWAEHAAAPDLTALAMRSRVSEAEALTDHAGLGAFAVLEWVK